MKTTDSAVNFAHDTVDKIADVTHEAVGSMKERSEQLRHAEKDMVDNCSSYVRSNPVTSLGVAVAAGFVLSRLLSGR